MSGRSRVIWGKRWAATAMLRRLRRLASGGFTLDGAVAFDRLDQIRETGADDLLLPLEAGLSDLPEVAIRLPEATRLRNGNPAPVTHTVLDYGDEAWASLDGVPIAIVDYRAGMLHPSRVFVMGNQSEAQP